MDKLKDGMQMTRRDFLIKASSLVAGISLSSLMLLNACGRQGEGTHTENPSESVIYSPDILRTERIPPGQFETKGFPVFQYSPVSIFIPEWKFTISGLVENPLAFDYSGFMKLTHEKVYSDVHCVTGWSRLGNLWEGVSSRTIADLVGLKPEAKFVIVSANYGDYTSNLSLADFLGEDVLFATKHDNQPLEPEHGAPVRLVVPRLYFWKSVKWVTHLEFTDTDQPGFWESRGYHNHGDPWEEERWQPYYPGYDNSPYFTDK